MAAVAAQQVRRTEQPVEDAATNASNARLSAAGIIGSSVWSHPEELRVGRSGCQLPKISIQASASGVVRPFSWATRYHRLVARRNVAGL